MSSIMNIMSPSWAVVGQIWVLTVTYKRQVFLVRNPRDMIPTEGMCKIQLVTSSSLWGNREAKATGLKVKFVLSSVLWILFSVPVVRTLLLMPMILLQANLFACKQMSILPIHPPLLQILDSYKYSHCFVLTTNLNVVIFISFCFSGK